MRYITFLFWSFLCVSAVQAQIAQSVRDQPITKVDVCIYGATAAGVMAAYTAGKMGKSVLLIEPGTVPGGMSSGGLGQTDIGNKYAITGLSREFYRRMGRHYGKFEQWTFEPHVAEQIFRDFLQESGAVVLYQHRIIGIRKEDRQIKSITVEFGPRPEPGSNRVVQAAMYIDCSYEGDLLARAGVSYTVGREANAQYGETFNGVQLLTKHQFPDGVDPYKIAGRPESGLLWGISPDSLAVRGSGDKKIQTYNFRICLTHVPENKIEITRPAAYDSSKYELLIRQIRVYQPDSINWQLLHIAPIPNHKTDINNCGGFSSDMIGMNYEYPEADYAKRDQIIREHEDYTRGWLYFLGHDPRVPVHLRKEMLTWGYPRDEYNGHDHFTSQLYVREARRMVGLYVMTQHNCEGLEVVNDGIAMAAYTMDSHNCQRLVVGGMVKNEGDVQVGGFGPYPIAYRALVPKETECTNLLVPVCLSATHIAYGSIRMEPVFMVLGQSAAVAASLALDKHVSVQSVPFEEIQEILKRNPLADGSSPEVQIDDLDSLLMEFTGHWEKDLKAAGRYGRSVSLSREPHATASFKVPPNTKPGFYSLYVYCPPVSGVSDKLQITLQFKKRITRTIDFQRHHDDWLLLGQYEIDSHPGQALKIESAGTGIALADAVLLIPVSHP